MKRLFVLFLCGYFILFLGSASYAYAPFGRKLCKKSDSYSCLKIKRRQSWETLFPNDSQRMLVMRLNRMNTPLYPGVIIAVPKNLNTAQLMDFSPFPARIKPSGQKVLFVDPTVLAWGAYNSSGQLLRWGPASLGSNYCPDLGHRCHSPVGTFHVYQKGSVYCKSHKFPLPRGGAPMPYCMFFHGGAALHGEPSGLPGDNASHGCIRLFVSDAKWLSESFVVPGTLVIVEPYGSFSHPTASRLALPSET